MVCKWFRTLDGAKRIDFLNGMLHLCFPLELRFLGSCIEELARKDYSYLRDAELKANTSQEIQLMDEISDKVTRSKMIVTLALLSSNNFECARLLFDLLNVDIVDLLDRMQTSLDEKIADEFLLLLMMAANHPAFDFQMKTRMSQLYLCADQKLKARKIIPRESETDLCLCAATHNANVDTVDNSPDSPTNRSSDKNTNISSTNFETNIENDDTHNTSKLLSSGNICNTNRRESKFNEMQKTNQEQQQNIEHQNTSNVIFVVDNNNNSDSHINNDEQDVNVNESNKDLFKSSAVKCLDNKNDESDKENKNSNENENEVKKSNSESSYPIIETINFDGVKSIKGTDNYKFLIKVSFFFNFYFKFYLYFFSYFFFSNKL